MFPLLSFRFHAPSPSKTHKQRLTPLSVVLPSRQDQRETNDLSLWSICLLLCRPVFFWYCVIFIVSDPITHEHTHTHIHTHTHSHTEGWYKCFCLQRLMIELKAHSARHHVAIELNRLLFCNWFFDYISFITISNVYSTSLLKGTRIKHVISIFIT